MVFAVIADVHGNLPALRAVMADAMARGAEGFLFAGDYCVSAPWADGVVDVMRGLPQAVCVRGNEERYLHLPDGDDAQFAVSRWTARSMKKENIAWLDALPEKTGIAPSRSSLSTAMHSATKPPVIEAVRVPPSAWMTSQSMVRAMTPATIE